MSYDFDYSIHSDTADVALALVGVALMVLLIVGFISLVCYIFYSVGLHRLAKRRGLKHAWLAWLPVGSDWLLGCVSDQYQYVVNGKNTHRRTILLVLSIVSVVFSTGVNSGVIGEFIRRITHMAEYGIDYEMSVAATGGFGALLSSGVSIALFVFQCIALYDLYTSCSPNNNVLFLVLGIIFGVAKPFFIFACRNKDGGMPPRRNVNPAYESREPWGEL